MGLSEALLPEFDHEMAGVRKTLERITDEKLDWKPHEKSTSMGGLATHLANLPSWASLTIKEDSFDMAPPGGQPFRLPQAGSVKEILDKFDENVASARAAIAGASDEHLFKNWSLLSGGNNIFTMPKIAVLRSFVMNHIIHHRAQLGVYLRLNDVPVPSLYGPSADEEM
jgi:uncharacterized damage-inducible protein DinB